ncbi:hypothetical protein MPSEU_000089400 [Mayamaea pseudoterrestris]|nr:hypothetical protein MPSEU_000089400 [Mayamaea pseudoterrestris]
MLLAYIDVDDDVCCCYSITSSLLLPTMQRNDSKAAWHSMTFALMAYLRRTGALRKRILNGCNVRLAFTSFNEWTGRWPFERNFQPAACTCARLAMDFKAGVFR